MTSELNIVTALCPWIGLDVILPELGHVDLQYSFRETLETIWKLWSSQVTASSTVIAMKKGSGTWSIWLFHKPSSNYLYQSESPGRKCPPGYLLFSSLDFYFIHKARIFFLNNFSEQDRQLGTKKVYGRLAEPEPHRLSAQRHRIHFGSR